MDNLDQSRPKNNLIERSSCSSWSMNPTEWSMNPIEWSINLAAIFTLFTVYELYQFHCQFILNRIVFFVLISTYRMTASVTAACLLEDGDIKEGMNL